MRLYLEGLIIGEIFCVYDVGGLFLGGLIFGEGLFKEVYGIYPQFRNDITEKFCAYSLLH